MILEITPGSTKCFACCTLSNSFSLASDSIKSLPYSWQTIQYQKGSTSLLHLGIPYLLPASSQNRFLYFLLSGPMSQSVLLYFGSFTHSLIKNCTVSHCSAYLHVSSPIIWSRAFSAQVQFLPYLTSET